MAAPPFDVGAAHARLTPLLRCVAAERFWGAPGTVLGVALRTLEAAPEPASFVARTVNVYAVPFVRPVTVHDVAPPVEHVAPPGLAVAVYDVITLPPLDAGADQLRATWPLPGVALVSVGAPGTVLGVAERPFDAA